MENMAKMMMPLLNLDPIRRIRHELRQRLGLRNKFGDRIIIEDEVLVWQGDKLLFKSKGHIVNQGLICLINLMGNGELSAATSYVLPSCGTAVNNKWSNKVQYMRVGTGVGVTVGTMTALITADGTAPNTQGGAISSPATGTYRVAWTATWNAGTLGAITVTEMGIFLCLKTGLGAFEATYLPSNAQMFSRLSSSDGDFSSFVVNVAVPLTIEWRLTFTFA